MFLAIEGNTGSGKSTLAKILQRELQACIIQEPFDEWINVKGHNLFETFQANPNRWAYAFQSYALLTFIRASENIIENNKNCDIFIMDRTPYSGLYYFMPMLLQNNQITTLEWFLYKEHAKTLLEKFNYKPNGLIYLRTSPLTCYRRNQERNRPTDNPLPLTFFQQLHLYHEKFFINPEVDSLNIPRLIVDGDVDFINDSCANALIISQIKDFIDIIKTSLPSRQHALNHEVKNAVGERYSNI